jgi:hypothetical protein
VSLTLNSKETAMLNPIAPRRLFLTADKARIVAEDDPGARFLLANEGGEIPAEYRDLFASCSAPVAANDGGEIPAEETFTADGEPIEPIEADEKAAAKAPNKSADKAANKSH